MNHLNESDEIRTKVLTENTAQEVLNHLNTLESKRDRVRTRWIWELLQNARDTSVDDDRCLVASVKCSPEEIVFQHNGAKFKMEEIAHLIYHGSTKVEDEGTIGQYGSGFLTTHLLSPTIAVSGQLDDGKTFKFYLKREVGSVKALRDLMNRAWDDFSNSLSKASTLNDFTTQFRYPITGEDSASAAKDGLGMLKRCAPLAVIFNKAFSRINIKSPGETISFEVVKRAPLPQDGLQEITVSENENGRQKDRMYLLAESTQTSVAIPLEPTGDGGRAVLSIRDSPRLFLGFPLIGTEPLSFPAVINSFEFIPTPERDGVALWLANNEVNRGNQAAMEEACDLLIRLIRFAASSGWYSTYVLANVPAIAGQSWLDSEKLRGLLKEQLIERIRQIPAVLCEHEARTPQETILPLAKEDADVEALWGLLADLKEFRQKLPRQNEAVGWCNVLRSWASVSECQALSFDEAIDGRKLAERVEEGCESLEELQQLLREGFCAVEWLNQLYQFLKDSGLFDDKIRSLSIFPTQDGRLDELFHLHHDQGIAKELKDIAKLLGWDIRYELRDTRLTPLADEAGKGGWNSEYVVGEIIKKLQERAENNPDDDFGKASVSLFAWIVGQKIWNLLRGFPVFAKENSVGGLAVIYLPRATQDSDRPLAPVLAWSEDLRPFDDLFPQNCILADAFFEAVPALDTWRILNEQGFIRTNILITHDVNFQKFFPDHPLPEGVHRTSDRVLVTDIVNRTEIMSRVRDSQSRARLFWRFLTEWLAKEDLQALESKKAKCECEKTHRYYPAAWIEPLRENNWVRLGNEVRDYATAQSLANLLRDSGWKPSSLNENPAAVKLLEAIGVTRFDLMRELTSKSDEERAAMEDQLTYLITATEGDLSHVREFVEDLQKDEELPDILKKRREDRQIGQENQRLGTLVEELVKESLKDEGFTVKRTGTGSDYEIELSQGGQRWLVEVKATRGHEVRDMTGAQARTAVKEGDRFLLCVVQVEPGTEPQLDTVRANMRFVEDIGSRVADLCDKLKEFEKFHSNITVQYSPGIRLEVEAGSPRICVAKSVWDKGFRLEDLAEKLG